MLSTCLLGVKEFFTSRSASPKSSLPASSLVSWTHFGYALLMALKISLLKVDGWDLDQARDEMQFSSILEETVSSLEPSTKQRKQMRTETGISMTHTSDEHDIFDRFIRQMRRMKSLYITIVTPQAVASAVLAPTSPTHLQTMNESTIAPGPAFIDGLAADMMLPDFDQSFWQDMYHNDDDPWTILCRDAQIIN